LPALTWQRLTGDAVNGYALLELKPGSFVSADGTGEKDMLSLMAESTELLELRDARCDYLTAAWQYMFTTSMQEQDNPADFRWRFTHRDNPAIAKFAGSPSFSLSSLRASQTSPEEQAFAQKGWQAPTHVQLSLDKRSITEGDSVQIWAEADGVPFPTFRWFESEQGEPVELPGQFGPKLQQQPKGRARHYYVKARNRAGEVKSNRVELTICQPARLPSKEPLSVHPKIAARPGAHMKTAEEIAADRRKWEARIELQRVAGKRRLMHIFVVCISVFALLTIAVVIFGPKIQTRVRAGRTTSTNGMNQVTPTTSISNPAAVPFEASANTNFPPGGGMPPPRSRPPPLGDVENVPSPKPASRSPLAQYVDLTTLPLRWISTNVGGFHFRVFAETDGTKFILTGAGKIIGGKVDNFSFIRQPESEALEFSARLVTAGATNQGCCGIMMRESDEPGAPFAFVGSSAGKVTWIHRNTNNIPTSKSITLHISRIFREFSG
jgi:hypothetical protein